MHSLVKTIKHDWLELTLKEWAKELNLPYITLYTRFKKGYTIEKLLSKGKLPRWNPKWQKSKKVIV